MTKDQIIEYLSLAPHPLEGGYFRRTYESELRVHRKGAEKRLLTSIYYMLTDDYQYGPFLRKRSDIVHYHHMGSPIMYLVITPGVG